MKNFIRVFRYGDGIKSKAPAYIIFTILGVIFSAFNLALLIPFLDILFDKVEAYSTLKAPENVYSVQYAIYYFKSVFIQIIEKDGKPAALIFVCSMIAASVFLTNLFRYLANIISARMRTDIIRNMRVHLFNSVSALHLGFFTNERKGDLISRLTNDIQEIESTVLSSLKTLFKEPLTVVVYFIVLFLISFKLTLFTIIILPLMGGILAEIIKRLKKQARLSQQSIGRVVNIFDELLSGMRVVKAFNAQPVMQQKMLKEANHYRSLGFSMAVKRELASPLSEFLGVGIVITILYYGTILILNKESTMEPSAFISYLAFFSQIISPSKLFSQGITNLQKGMAASERIFEITNTTSQIISKPNAVKIPQFEKEIEFRNVSFSYDKEVILKNINVVIPRGKMIALVGASGAGKSTLADLIPRFYDPTEGQLLIDGHDLRDCDLHSMRSHMGIVTQESILFNDTVFENIAFGKPGSTMEEVIQAAKIANAHEFIESMEEGYNTFIGERGGRLSGGQRQRLSIARAVLKDPAILILDEATSALDSESERLVQDALSKLMKNRTSIVIAHRLSTIQHADEILVMDSGQVIERGNHESLVNQNGIYKKLSSMQQVFVDAK